MKDSQYMNILSDADRSASLTLDSLGLSTGNRGNDWSRP
jgi:hypothetical protein